MIEFLAILLILYLIGALIFIVICNMKFEERTDKSWFWIIGFFILSPISVPYCLYWIWTSEDEDDSE